MGYEKITTMKVSKELTLGVNLLGKKGESYEDIIWGLLKLHDGCSCNAVLDFEVRKK